MGRDMREAGRERGDGESEINLKYLKMVKEDIFQWKDFGWQKSNHLTILTVDNEIKRRK